MSTAEPPKGCCATCAFRPGTEANTYEPTQLTIKLCLMAEDDFGCHERSGTCAGFAARLASQPAQPAWKRELAGKLLEIYSEAREGWISPTKADELVKQAVLSLGGRE